MKKLVSVVLILLICSCIKKKDGGNEPITTASAQKNSTSISTLQCGPGETRTESGVHCNFGNARPFISAISDYTGPGCTSSQPCCKITYSCQLSESDGKVYYTQCPNGRGIGSNYDHICSQPVYTISPITYIWQRTNNWPCLKENFQDLEALRADCDRLKQLGIGKGICCTANPTPTQTPAPTAIPVPPQIIKD